MDKSIVSFPKKKTFYHCFILFNVLVATVPVFNLFQFLKSTGANNISADTFLLIPLLEKLITHTYSWDDLFFSSVINGHLSVMPLILLWLFSKITDLNIFSILNFGILLGILRVFFIFDAVTFKNKNFGKWFLLPILSALIFSPSQISTFEFELTTLQLNISQLGLFLGIWALVRFPKSWLALLLAVFGGTMATASHGSGVLVWPILFFGLLLLGFKDIFHYIFLILIGILVCSPYLYVFFSFQNITQRPDIINMVSDPFFQGIGLNFISGIKSPFITWFNPRLFIQSLGWPFTPNYSSEMALQRGVLVILVLFLGLFFILLRKNKSLKRHSPAILLIAYGVLSIWFITCFRLGLTPWYSTIFLTIYLGIVTLAFGTLFDSYQAISRSEKLWGVFALFVVGYLFFTSNLNYKNKTSYLKFRSSISASCIRNYKIAPTYCESTYFWTMGYPMYFSKIFSTLEKYHLSVFSRRQRWTLQGDYILNSVFFVEKPGIPDIFWTEDLEAKAVEFSKFEHLNLFLHTPNAIEWVVSLPDNLIKADFNSAFGISTSAPRGQNDDGILFEIYIALDNGPYRLYHSRYVPPQEREWQPFSIPLKDFAGKKIKIKLSSSMKGNYSNDWAMYRYPVIDLEIFAPLRLSAFKTPIIKPLNTDLSPKFLNTGPNDINFAINDPLKWEFRDLKILKKRTNDEENIRLNGSAQLKYIAPINVPISEFSHLYFQMKVPYEQYPITPKVTLVLDGASEFRKEFVIPPLSDGQLHSYSYDLKLLGVSRNTKVKGLKVEFKRMIEQPSHQDIIFSNLKMISKKSI